MCADPPSAHMGARRLIVTVVKYPRNINEKRHRPRRVPSLPCARSASAPERAARPPAAGRRRALQSDHPARPWPHAARTAQQNLGITPIPAAPKTVGRRESA